LSVFIECLLLHHQPVVIQEKPLHIQEAYYNPKRDLLSVKREYTQRRRRVVALSVHLVHC
jgi:hypothetical protein